MRRPDFYRALFILGALLIAGNTGAGLRPVLAVHAQTGTTGTTPTTGSPGNQTTTETPEDLKRKEDEKAKREKDLKAKREADLKAKREADLKAKRAADLKAKREADLKAKREADLKAKREADLKAKREADLNAKREADLNAKQEADLKAKREQERRRKRRLYSGALGIVAIIGSVWFLKSRYKRQVPPPGIAFTKANRSVAFQFHVRRLPLLARVSWERAAEISAAPVLRCDDDIIELNSGQWRSWWPSRNKYHSISLTLPEGDLPDSLEFKLNIVLAFPPIFRAPFERKLSAAEFQRLNTPPAKVELSPYEEALRPQIRIEPAAPNATSQPRIRKPPKEALIDVANDWLASGVPSRPIIERRFADLGFKPEFYSPTRVPESANSVYTRHWFIPDSHAGAWLMLIDDGDRLIVPVDRQRFRGDTMRHYVSSLYDGVARNFPDGTLRIDRLCLLVPAREPDEYQVTQRGHFAGSIVESPTHNHRHVMDTQSTPQYPVDYAMDDLRQTVARIEARLDRADAAAVRSAAAVENHKRDLDQRRFIEETVSNVINSKLSAIERSIADVRNELTLVKKAVVLAPVAVTTVQSAPPPTPEPLPPPSIEPRAQEITPRASVVSDPTLPSGWQSTLVTGGIDNYLAVLQASQRELAALGGGGSVTVVHLIEAADGGTFQVHDEPLDVDSAGLVAWCSAKPGAQMRTPPRQLFLGWRESEARSIWILCPTGACPALGFHYQDLIRNAPSGGFTIASVRSPARLDPSDGESYRVSSLMDVEFE